MKKNFTELFITDAHLGYHDKEATKNIDTILNYLFNEKNHIDVLVYGGDMIDFESVSSFLQEDPNAVDSYYEINKFLSIHKKIYQMLQPEKVYYIEGNHEDRLRKYILSKAPALYNMVDLSKILINWDIEYVSNSDLLINYKKPFKLGNLYHLHGDEIPIGTVNIARNMFLKSFENVIFGHYHTTSEYLQRDLANNIKGCWSVGCLSNVHARYARKTNWNSGFAIIEYDTKFFRVQNLKIIAGRVV